MLPWRIAGNSTPYVWTDETTTPYPTYDFAGITPLTTIHAAGY